MKNSKKWSSSEVRVLKSLIRENASYELMSNRLGRTPNAIQCKKSRIYKEAGISRKPFNARVVSKDYRQKDQKTKVGGIINDLKLLINNHNIKGVIIIS